MIDVAVLGGGLAGLTFARELALKRPGTTITVLEASEHPPPLAAHKVGESCVEIAGHWLVNVLELGDHLANEHLPKLGLRFFFGDGPLEQRLEVGPIANKVPVPFEGLLLPSYQLDRGLLEGHLAKDCARLGITFRDRARVRSVELDAAQGHTITVRGDEEPIRARYVVDATGRSGVLKKRLKIDRPSGHVAHAAWFRVPGQVKVDDWASRDAFHTPMEEEVRWRSTVHLMGTGYWVWFIPLSTDIMSIGVVVGDQDHDFAAISSFERAMEWLDQHEPQAAERIRAHLDGSAPLDFLTRKAYPLDVERVFTGEAWGLTGEAGAFVDPLYSPGSDFIAMVNRGQVDLAMRYLDGEDITERADRTEAWFRVMYQMFLRVYQGMYPMFGNPQVMSAKILFDTGFYWAWPTLLYRNDALMDVDYVDTLGDLVPRMVEVQSAAQRFLKAWAARENPPCTGSVDQFDVATIWRIYVSLIRNVDHERLTQRLEANLVSIEAFLEVLFRHAARDFPQVAAAERIDVRKLALDPERAFDPAHWDEVGLFGGPDRSEEVARVTRECQALWVHDDHVTKLASK